MTAEPENRPTDTGLRTATWLARALDDWYIDPIIGFLLPGVGDLLGALLGLYIVLVGVQRRVSRLVIARMLVNIALDTVVGVIPVVGDVYDVVYKANRRNLALLIERQPLAPARATDWLVLAGAMVLFCAAAAAPVVFVVWLVKTLLQHGG